MLQLLKLVLGIASIIAQYAHDKQLMDAGAAKAVLEGVKDVQDKMAIATAARSHANELPVDSDPHNRNKPKN